MSAIKAIADENAELKAERDALKKWWNENPSLLHHRVAAAEAEIARLREIARERGEILRSIQQEFMRHGGSFPDGFDVRLFRFVDDACAALSPTQAPEGGQS